MERKLRRNLFNLFHPDAECLLMLFALHQKNIAYNTRIVFENLRSSCDIPLYFKKIKNSKKDVSGTYFFFEDEKYNTLFKKLNYWNKIEGNPLATPIPRIEIYHCDVKGAIPFALRTCTLAHELFHHQNIGQYKDKNEEEQLADFAIIEEIKKYRPAIITGWYWTIRQFILKNKDMEIEEYLKMFNLSLKDAFKDMKKFNNERRMQKWRA